MTTDTRATRYRTGIAASPMAEQTAGSPRRFRVKGWPPAGVA
jgi:hypothetical protein